MLEHAFTAFRVWRLDLLSGGEGPEAVGSFSRHRVQIRALLAL